MKSFQWLQDLLNPAFNHISIVLLTSLFKEFLKSLISVLDVELVLVRLASHLLQD
jgi:hypothetical protein